MMADGATKSPYNKDATREKIRSRYGSVKEFCRQANIEYRTFGRALNEGWGKRRRGSISQKAINRLRTEGLLVETVDRDARAVN